MLAVQITAARTLAWVPVAEREPGTGEVRVRVLEWGICGTDVHGYWGHLGFPFVPGHEICGVVEATGPEVNGFREGERVCVNPVISCGDCAHCRGETPNLCERATHLGGPSSRMVLPARALHHVPDSLSDSQAAMVEPVAVAVHAVRRAGVKEGETIAVVGAGAIGLLCAEVARAQGAVLRLAVDLLPQPVEAARGIGFERGIVLADRDEQQLRQQLLQEGLDLDVAFDAAASGSSFSLAVATLRKRGRAVVVGLPLGPVPADLEPVMTRELEVLGSFCYGMAGGTSDFERAISLLADGRIDAARLVTHTLPFDRVEEAFRIAADKSTGSVKVTVRMAD